MGPSGSWRNLASGQCFRRHDNLSHLQQKLFIPMNQIESLFSLVMVSILFAIQHDTQEEMVPQGSLFLRAQTYTAWAMRAGETSAPERKAELVIYPYRERGSNLLI